MATNSKSLEQLIEHIKSIFRIDPVPTRGFDKVRAIRIAIRITIPNTRLLQL